MPLLGTTAKNPFVVAAAGWRCCLILLTTVLLLLWDDTGGFLRDEDGGAPSCCWRSADAFVPAPSFFALPSRRLASADRRRRPQQQLGPFGTTTASTTRIQVSKEEIVANDSPIADWTDDGGDDGDESAASQKQQQQQLREGGKRSSVVSRWEALNPKAKSRIVREGQERAVANKKKRESPQAKKRRVLMFLKDKRREQKRASRVKRPVPFQDRVPLANLASGAELNGTVISLTNFGAYVDVGTDCDGLLHVSQMTREYFVEHPRQIVSPGERINVTVRSTNPELKKLHLTMLPRDVVESEIRRDPRRRRRRGGVRPGGGDDGDDDSDYYYDNSEYEQRIQIQEIRADDELWGEIRRVTDYGSYVDVGAVVDGFLHFMDHPAFGWPVDTSDNDGDGASQPPPRHPTEYMSVNDRVRVWVSDVDAERKRIKLTANRPPHLPGPRREILF